MRTVLSVIGVLIAASAAFGAGEKPKAKPQAPAMMMPPPAVLAGKVTVMTEGVSIADTVRHITDISSIRDDNAANDTTEDFAEYGMDETYRATVYLPIDSSYVTPYGGKACYADDPVLAIEPELGAITDDSDAGHGLVIAYVYFTVTEEYDPMRVVFIGETFKENLSVSLIKAANLEGAVYLIAAAYDEKGRMLGAERREASFTGVEATEDFTFKSVTGKIAWAKVFAVDADFKPLGTPCKVKPRS